MSELTRTRAATNLYEPLPRTETKRIMSAPRYHPPDGQQTRGSLTGSVQPDPGDVQDPGHTLWDMNNMYGSPAGPQGGPDPAGLPDPSAHYSPASPGASPGRPA